MVKPVEELMLEIKREYDKNKRGWRILRSRDARRHYDSYIVGPKSIWCTKTELKTPYRPIGVGERVKTKPDDEVKKIATRGENFVLSELYPLGKGGIATLGIGKFSKDSVAEFRDVISGQDKLAERLRKGLEKLLRKEEIGKGYL